MEHLTEIMIFLFVKSYYEPETSSDVLINEGNAWGWKTGKDQE
jgi:hypothetical protein